MPVPSSSYCSRLHSLNFALRGLGHLLILVYWNLKSKLYCFAYFDITSYVLFAGQKLAESLHPSLDELRDVWPWLLLAGLCGGILTIAIAAAVLTTKRWYKGSSWLRARSWKHAFSLPERQPLIRSNEIEETNQHNYQTTMWRQSLSSLALSIYEF